MKAGVAKVYGVVRNHVNKLLLLLVLLAIVSASFVAYASLTKVWNPSTKTMLIQNSGVNITEVQILDVQRSIGLLQVKLRVKNYQNISLTPDENNTWATRLFKGLAPDSISTTYEEQYGIDLPLYDKTCNPYTLENLSVVENCTQILNGTSSFIRTREVLFNFFNFNYQANQQYIIHIYVTRPPALGEQSSDIAPKVKGIDFYPEFVWWNSNWAYCTNLNVTVSGFEWKENQTALVGNVNFSSLSVIPYNESIRIVSQPCNNGGTELKSAYIPQVQNSTGHTTFGRLVINPSGVVSSNTVYGLYFNYSPIPQSTYPTDLVSYSSNVSNTYLYDVFEGGCLRESYYLTRSDSSSWVDRADATCIDGLSKFNQNLLTISDPGAGCVLQENFSMASVYNCSRHFVFENHSVLHYYYGYSNFKQMRIITSFNSTALYSFIRPNQSTTKFILYYYNKTLTSSSNVDFNLTRGMIGAWLNESNDSIWYIWSNKKNATVVAAIEGSYIRNSAGSGLTLDEDRTWDNNTYITRLYLKGASNDTKIHNATNYWKAFEDTPIIFAVNTVVTSAQSLPLPNLITPANNSILGVLPEFNWTNVTNSYTIYISNDSFSSIVYSRNLSTNKDNGVTLPTGQITKYSWKVVAVNGSDTATSLTFNFTYSQWNITFNITGSQSDQRHLNDTTIKDCTYSSFNQGTDYDNYYGPFAFPNGTWTCTFNRSNYYPKTQNFNADSDKVVNIVMPEAGGATFEEHTWLEAIYNCVILKQCDLYNLLLEINQSAGYTWQHVKPTDTSVVLNETFVSRNLSSISNITINYTINIPIKPGYGLGDFLPVRIGFWFLNETNGTCYSQGTLPTGVTVIEPYCNPLMVQTLGPMGYNVSFRVDLRPNLPNGTYNITRIVEIDPDNVWIGYGQEGIGSVVIKEPNLNSGSDVVSFAAQQEITQPETPKAQETTITGKAIVIEYEEAFRIALIIILILAVAVVYFYSKRKK